MIARGRGFQGYNNVGNWGWEFYPPPYNFLAPRNAAAQPAPVLPSLAWGGFGAPRGVGDCGCGCKGKGSCGSHAGQPAGMGLFESGLDWSQWGVGEWTAAAVGAYFVFSLVGDLFKVGRGARRVGGAIRKRRAKKTRRSKLQQELAEL